jgi:hypothetical protein
MNRVEIIPDHLKVEVPKYSMSLYFTGDVPHEFGYVLFEGGVKIDEQKVGTLGTKGIFSTLRDFLSKKVSNPQVIYELLLETRFQNRSLIK